MGMTVGSGSGQKAEINVTPMIDVLLVLIIIFMVITPITSRGLNTPIPQQAADTKTPAPSNDLVIEVARNNQIHLNREPVELASLEGRLAALYRSGAGGHLFVKGDRDLEFGDVVHVIDVARGAGWDRIGLMTQ
jgi:biopolymer transport protein TolR